MSSDNQPTKTDNLTEDQIREQARAFFQEHIAPWEMEHTVYCLACRAANCTSNQQCIRCGCQLQTK